MLITPHALVGIAIATQFDRVWMVAPLAIGSHFILDSVPHWDLDTEDISKKDVFISALDVGLAIFLATILTWGNSDWEMMWLGGRSASIPDAHNLLNALYNSPKRLKKYTLVHNKYHYGKYVRFLPGIALQLFVIMMSLVVMSL